MPKPAPATPITATRGAAACANEIARVPGMAGDWLLNNGLANNFDGLGRALLAQPEAVNHVLVFVGIAALQIIQQFAALAHHTQQARSEEHTSELQSH